MIGYGVAVQGVGTSGSEVGGAICGVFEAWVVS